MRRALLVCGVVSSLVYVTADVLGTLRWEGYSYVDQTISELAAADAPSRPVVMPLFLAYDALLLAFAAGVAGSRVRAARVTAAMLAAVALIGIFVSALGCRAGDRIAVSPSAARCAPCRCLTLC